MKLSLSIGLSLAALVCSVGIASTSLACAPAKEPEPEPPECEYANLAELEAAYVAESVKACKGKTRQTCEAMPAIEAKYSDKRESWIRCRRR